MAALSENGLIVLPEIVVWFHDTFDNISEITIDFIKYLKEGF